MGKIILITGGGKGIGYGNAKKCVAEGAKVLISGRQEETLRRACRELGESCQYIKFDVSSIIDIPSFLNEAFLRMNGIDSLVSNAGISFLEGSFYNVSESGFDAQFIV